MTAQIHPEAHCCNSRNACPPKGLLERPIVPPTFASASFKLFLVGRSGIGKSSLVSLLAASSTEPHVETSGVRVTRVFWPVRLRPDATNGARLVLVQLSLWDAGDAIAKKYAHIQQVRLIHSKINCAHLGCTTEIP